MWLEVQISNKKKIIDKTFYHLLSLEIQIKQANAYFEKYAWQAHLTNTNKH